jgi:hypothetical protein
MRGEGVAQVTVFNPLSWPRKESVEFALSLPRGAAENLAARRSTEAVRTAVLSADLHSHGSIRDASVVIAAELPALGFASYSLAPVQETSEQREESVRVDAENLLVTMAPVREKDGRFSMPLAYAMYYTWGTRMLNGHYTYDFAIYPFEGHWVEADLHRPALEYNFPCVSVCTAPGFWLFGCGKSGRFG